jgi:hypothetical protein
MQAIYEIASKSSALLIATLCRVPVMSQRYLEVLLHRCIGQMVSCESLASSIWITGDQICASSNQLIIWLRQVHAIMRPV